MRKLFVGLVLLLSACSSTPDYSGQWVGGANDTIAGFGQTNLTITQSGSQLSGSWQIAFREGVNSGSLQGTASADAVTVQLFPSNPNACPFNVTATRSGDTMNGNYSSFSCSRPISGTLSIERR